MSDGYRNGAFALGLTIGASVVLLLFLFGQKVYDMAKCYQTQECERSATKYEGQDFPSSWWWDWTGRLVTSDDTFAQWIMSFFTIAAVLLVWRTLVATQEMVRDTKKMALDTREIGEAQVRAYCSVSNASCRVSDSSAKISFTITNSGQSPALAVLAAYDCWAVPVQGRKLSVDIRQRASSDKKTPIPIMPAAGQHEIKNFDCDITGTSKPNHGTLFQFRISIFYKDIFGKNFDHHYIGTVVENARFEKAKFERNLMLFPVSDASNDAEEHD